jgi:nucleotide-binding universal stress UspA family protein
MSSFTFNIKTILVPVDFSDTSLKGLEYAITMAKLNHADLILLHVTEFLVLNPAVGEYSVPPIYNQLDYDKDILEKTTKRLQQLAETTKRENKINAKAITAIGEIKQKILDAAQLENADIIIMGTHGTNGFREFITGSNTYRIVSEATCPVLSVRHHSQTPGFKHILLPFTDQPHSREKVNYALKLAEMYNSTLYILGIDMEESPEHLHKIELEAKQLEQIAKKYGITCEVTVESSGMVAENILKHAKQVNADLILVMSGIDRMSISEWVMGPFTKQIINHSNIPILSIQPAFNSNTVDLKGYGFSTDAI